MREFTLTPALKVGDTVRLPSGKIGIVEKITTENKYKNLRARVRVRYGPAVRHRVLVPIFSVELINKINE